MSFEKFGFSREIMVNINERQYKVPTPVQQQAIPVVLAGHDVMGLAQTGTGKTAAFALPLLQHLINGKHGQLRALIVAPTRELAEQINENIIILGKGTGLRSLAVYGGVNCNPQIKAVKRGVDIIVACPGRLLDLIEQNVVNLNNLEVLVLDEADHMFDMGFLPDIRKIIRYVPQNRQTLLFSATMPPDIRCLADKVLRNPVHIKIAFEEPLDTISHVLFPIAQHQKTGLLLRILKNINSRSVLIFTRTKHRAKKLGLQLTGNGFKAVSLQGNLSQNRRQEALDGFRDGLFRIMVATDIAARGIDVSCISHVINYDIPDTPDAYTHRTGRTGRATSKGEAFTFVTTEEKKLVIDLERKTGISFSSRILPDFPYESAENLQQSNTGSFMQKKAYDKNKRHGTYRRKPAAAASQSARMYGKQHAIAYPAQA